MLQSLQPNTTAMMGLVLSTIGLLVAGGILLITITLFVSNTPIQTATEFDHITNIVTQHLLNIDAAWYEKDTQLILPQDVEPYHLSFSSEHITITSNNNHATAKSHVHTLPLHLLIRTTDDIWMTAADLHIYLFEESGRKGTKIDPIPFNHSLIISIKDTWNKSQKSYLLNPYNIDVEKAVNIEKALVYLDVDLDGIWQKHEPWLSYLLIYQYP